MDVQHSEMRQPQRKHIYQLFELCLSFVREKIAWHDTWVETFINHVRGERDPRNLLLIFTLVPTFIHLGVCSDLTLADLFESFACYFPIMFTPPPNDPFAIDPIELKEALRRCLAGHPHFAEEALPLLLEKLGASGAGVKMDAMLTITEALPVYPAHAFQTHLTALWDLLKQEVNSCPAFHFWKIADLIQLGASAGQ